MARGEITGRKPCVTAVRIKRSGPPQRAKPKVTAASEVTADSETAGSEESEDAEPEIEATLYAEPFADDTGAKPRIRGPPTSPAAYTIPTLCAAHHLSESFYFKLKNMGLGPREMRVGARVLITFEAAADWRREREAETAAASTVDE